MNNKYTKVELKELCSDFIVPQRDKPKVFDGNIPWCRIEDIQGKYLNGSLSNRNVSQKTVKDMNLRIMPVGTVICSCSASLGVQAITTKECCSNQTFIGLVCNSKIYNEYLYHHLSLYKQYFQNIGVGTTIKYISRENFEQLKINLPDFSTQKKIADVLSSIDKKIILNNKINLELENMAKTIYDYWFTQFDFPDKNGHPYKSSGGQMIYNELLKKEIPAGWELKNILDCCKVIDCLHSKKPDYCYEDENCYLLQLENLIDLKLIDLTNKYYVSKKDYETWTSKTKVKQGDLVVTNAGRVGGVSRIPNYIETGIGRNMTSIRPITISEYLLCYFFSSSDCDKQIRQNTDQGAFFQSLNVKGIKKLNLTIPPKEIQEKFDSLVGKMRLQIESNHKENEELTKLRDYLLPLLMNGQINIKE